MKRIYRRYYYDNEYDVRSIIVSKKSIFEIRKNLKKQ